MSPVTDNTDEADKPIRRKPDLSSPLLAGKVGEDGLATAYGKSLRTIRRWRNQGLPTEGYGSLILFDIEQVRAWLASRRRGGLAEPRRRAANAERRSGVGVNAAAR